MMTQKVQKLKPLRIKRKRREKNTKMTKNLYKIIRTERNFFQLKKKKKEKKDEELNWKKLFLEDVKMQFAHTYVLSRMKNTGDKYTKNQFQRQPEHPVLSHFY